jgi:hypothetical protein
VGRVLTAIGERVRVPRRHEQPQLLGVRVRSSVVLVGLSVEHRLHVVLFVVRRVLVAH